MIIHYTSHGKLNIMASVMEKNVGNSQKIMGDLIDISVNKRRDYMIVTISIKNRQEVELGPIKNLRLDKGLDMCCLTELSGMMGMFYICTVQCYGY